MARPTEYIGPASRRIVRLAVFCVLAVRIVSASTSDVGANQDAKPQNDGAVRVWMHNVKYRFTENISVQINYLNGAFVPVGDHAISVVDDKYSFKIHIDTAEIAMSPCDLCNLLN